MPSPLKSPLATWLKPWVGARFAPVAVKRSVPVAKKDGHTTLRDVIANSGQIDLAVSVEVGRDQRPWNTVAALRSLVDGYARWGCEGSISVAQEGRQAFGFGVRAAQYGQVCLAVPVEITSDHRVVNSTYDR